MDSSRTKKQFVPELSKELISRPILERISRMKAVLQEFKAVLDEDMQPLGITTSQLRMLWSIAENPGISGAKVARLCLGDTAVRTGDAGDDGGAGMGAAQAQ